MSRKDKKALLGFLKPFPADIQKRALWLREFVWDLHPECNELIYDNYNALAFGWSPTDRVGHTFCSIAAGRSSLNVHFGFYRGSQLEDPKKMLLGEGNQYRYILVGNTEDFPKTCIRGLMKQALSVSMAKVKDPRLLKHGMTIVKAVSKAKRSRGRAVSSRS